MDLSNADSVQLARTTGDYITPQVINPTGPIDYLRNNQPVEIQTPKGSAVIAQETERPFMPGPSLIQADLPQDQLAYKQNAIPVVNIDVGEWVPVGGGVVGGTMYQNTVTKEMRFSQPPQIRKDKPKEATVVLTQKPVQPSFSNIAIVAVVAVVLLIIAKW